MPTTWRPRSADLVAYENFRFVTRAFAKNEAGPTRKLYERLRASKRLSAGIYDAEALRELRTRWPAQLPWPPK